MPRTRREKQNAATREEIKSIARALMTELGTAGLSIRKIAREMGMTPPALYTYFPKLEDLITELIVDAFTNHAQAVRDARDTAAGEGQPPSQQLIACAHAYRRYALDNPTDFQLVYGNPIPGYQAPAEITRPAAQLIGTVFTETLMAAFEMGEIDVSQHFRHIPPTVESHYRQRLGDDPQLLLAFHVLNNGWGPMHGMVALEIYNHAQPVVGDTDAFYHAHVVNLFRSLGLEVADD